jgi:hypothetical protein
MPSAPNGRSKAFTSDSNRGQARSWHSSGATAGLRVQPAAAFSPRWISRRLRNCVRCFSPICSLVHGSKEEQPGGLWDRQGNHFLVCDIDGTREAARQRALPKTGDRPAPHHGPPRAHASMARQLWQPRQWTVPSRIASRSGSDPELRPGPWFSRSSCHPAPGWPLWHGGGRLRSGRLLVCHTRQRLSTVGSRRGSGPFAPPS